MKFRSLTFCLIVATSSSLLVGQAPPGSSTTNPFANGGSGLPGSAPSQPTNSNTMNFGSGGGFLESDTARAFSKDIFDTESDSINFEEGTFFWKGGTFNLGNSRIARARFERYLATPLVDDQTEVYLGVLDRIHELLSLIGSSEVKDSEQLYEEIYQAWQLLFVAARYEMDGGTSLVIANQVYNVWRIRDENDDLDRLQLVYEEEKGKIQDELVSGDWYSKGEYDDVQALTAQGRHTGKVFDGITEGTFRAEQLAETQLRISAIDAQRITNGIQAKMQFQTQILNMLLQRRYEHCLIACTFYRYVFKGSHTEMVVGQEQLEGFVPVSDFSPTIETIEFLAREAQNDVKVGMRTVDSLYDSGELYAALERMQETYFLGEYMPQVIDYPEEKKRKLLELYRIVREVENLADLKDYGQIEEKVDVISKMAYDFPAASVLSGVRSAQRMSNLSLLSAQQYLATGDTARAEVALARATEIWPLNPAIKTFTLDIASRADISTQAGVMFDQLYDRRDFRQIFDRRTEFAAALLQDPTRSKSLQEVVERTGRVDMLIAAAYEQAEQENAFEAWELLLRAGALDPTDAELARAKASIAPRVANFVGAVDAAERAENNGQYAISLSRYITAQDIYPASKTCRVGIERVGKKLMQQLAAEQGESGA